MTKKLKEVKSLSELEMLQVDNSGKELRMIELELIAIKAKKKIQDMEYDIEIGKKVTNHKTFSASRLALLGDIKVKHKLKSDLKAYDPITGEIKDE